MSNNKLDAQAKLKKEHDIIKTHPYRTNFNPEWKSDYIECLFNLSRVWSDYIWRGDYNTEEEKKLMRQFGRWVHNYNQELLICRRPNRELRRFDYFERMIQVTHEFIDTGSLPEYYELSYLWNSKHIGSTYVEKYRLITKEMCGIDSKILPCYLPMNYSVRADSEAIREHIMTDYHFSRKTAEEKESIYENWLSEVKPVLDWINSNHDETEWKHAVWESSHLAE